MRRLSVLATLLILLSACASGPAATPIATTEVIRDGQFADIIRQYCNRAKIKLINVQSDDAESSVSIEVAAMEGDTTQATAEIAMGLVAGVVAKSTDQTKHPHILHVVVIETATKANKRLTLSDPALSDFIAGKITQGELIKYIQIEVKQ